MMSSNLLKVLICDDSLLVRKKIKESLAVIGKCETIEASDGQMAIDKYKEAKPDLVLMDIVLPIKDGIEALVAIREFDSSANVVIISSTGTQSNIKKAIDSGALDFIQKPWQENQLQKIVENAMKKRGGSHV